MLVQLHIGATDFNVAVVEIFIGVVAADVDVGTIIADVGALVD